LGLKQLPTKNRLGAFVQDIREDIKGIQRKIAEFCHYHRWAFRQLELPSLLVDEKVSSVVVVAH